MLWSRGLLLGAVASLGLAFDAEPAAAELFRCTGPDGKTIFTDDKSLCPQAATYQPKAVVHSAGSRPAARAAEAGGLQDDRRRQAEAARSDEMLRWQQRRAQKEEELRDVAARRKSLVEYVSFCNRGGAVLRRDDAGIAQNVKCGELNDRLAQLDSDEAQLREYLATGLEEECRRSGCEPGWIR